MPVIVNRTTSRRRRISVRVQIATVFTSAMVLLAAVLIAFNFVQTSSFLVEFAKRQMLLAADAAVGRTEAFFQPVRSLLDTAVDGAILAQDPAAGAVAEPRGFFEAAERRMAWSPQAFNVFVGFPSGGYVRTGGSTPGIERMSGIPLDADPRWVRGMLRSDRSDWAYLPGGSESWVRVRRPAVDYDPRSRAWYRTAVDRVEPVWGEPLIGRNGLAVLTVSQALRHQGNESRGVAGVAVSLADLAGFFAGLKPSDNTVVFLARSDGRLIAHPVAPSVRGESAAPGLTVNLKADAAAARFPLEHAMMARVAPGSAPVVFEVEGRQYIGAARALRSATGLEAVLYAGAPTMDFIGFAVRANYLTVAISLLVFLGMMLVALRISRSLAAPIEELAQLASDVERKGVREVRPHAGSLVREIDDAGMAFNAMVEGLRERETIRDLFGRFVPEDVAAELIEREGALQPVETTCTILFTDIEGFTSMTERLGPSAVVDVLNDYFSVAAGIIEANNGVITQFQGDAIIAVYNVPITDPQHAVNAVRSALELLRVAAERTYAGEQIRIRVGVNTGEVVAGNVGAQGRLTYTVHGDAVNLAARLEAANKDLGTRILVSADTRNACRAEGAGFTFEPCGEIPVRGRREPVQIFSLGGPG